MNLLTILSSLEENNELHLARILILIKAFSGDDGTGTIEGLTKLAKLDFLLRYPVYLERALNVKNASTKKVMIADHERNSVESSMVRFKYGPWDFRYRMFLNSLIGKGLLKINVEGRTIVIGITDKGLDVADKFLQLDDFTDIVRRAAILKTHFDYKATYLMNFIYDTFPEIATLRFGETIET